MAEAGDLEQAKDLAWLVKDNLRTKHLVLSVEEALVELLQCEQQAMLELEPMGSYQRMLLHRLADNFGLKHESVGEGESRHLVIEKCEGSYIPSVLVSDVLTDVDVPVQPLKSELLRRSSTQIADNSGGGESSSEQPSTTVRLEEREAAYMSARQRIFSSGNDSSAATEVAAPRQRAAVSVAARRMINHALGNGKAEERNKSKQSSQAGAQRLFAHALGGSRIKQ